MVGTVALSLTAARVEPSYTRYTLPSSRYSFSSNTKLRLLASAMSPMASSVHAPSVPMFRRYSFPPAWTSTSPASRWMPLIAALP